MVSDNNKLGKFLREASNWSWEEFCNAEHDAEFTTNQSLIFAVIRACAMEKMDAIRLALNRIDGKLKTPVKIEMPKVYYLFPNAVADDTPPEKPGFVGELEGVEVAQETNALTGEIIERVEEPDRAEAEDDLPSLSLRQTLSKMSDFPRNLPEAIVASALQTQQWLNGQAQKPADIPRVKSVVAAHLLIMAQKRNIDALTEVFDQIDGKLVETIQVLGPDGKDIYIISYATTAPPGAIRNKEGVLMIEASDAQAMWAERLKDKK